MRRRAKTYRRAQFILTTIVVFLNIKSFYF